VDRAEIERPEGCGGRAVTGPVGVARQAATQPEFSDDTLALKFAEQHAANLRFTAAWNRWSLWDGRVWRKDDTLNVFDLARQICRKASTVCTSELIATRVASASTVAAVERLARADRRHVATIEQWDADPWLLNTPSGVVDLKIGKLRPANREDYLTKSTAVAPGGDCLTWLRFIERITSGNVGLQQFLQRMCGYALTGVTREQALFFLYGTGANGKSVFVNTISGMMNTYATTAPIETFIDTKSQNHPTDLAGLQGARIVTAVETEDGRRWAESKLKMMTGGERIPARFMRQDFFEYTPQFKLVIAGNHKPGLRSIDEAMRRRFNLLPFTVTIPASERDKELTDKLRAEWSGILQWCIEGCLAWQREGLRPPAIVTGATEEYLAAEDAFAQWLDDRTERRDGTWESATVLFDDWKRWAEANGEFVGSQKRFSENLTARSYSQARKNIGRGFAGIALRKTAVTDRDGSVDYQRHTRAYERSIGEHPSHPTQSIV
jgi:putative DNA primase/helicase